jgi:two-component system nitrogen regulation response regulator GlnG
MRLAIERALRKERPAGAGEPAAGSQEMLGRTPIMQAVFKRIALAAASDVNVLLRGESGVGKEIAARAIHRHSARSGAAFVAVNVAALSPMLAEAELFGHVQGAFTGATRARRGLLAEADGGTLFLDEIADIPLPLQVKLLRALDQGEVLPVGADRPVKTRFRVVSATHQDLKERVRAEAFRHDLYFRLSAFEIAIPPLRERADDVPLLARYFASRFGGPKTVLAEETIAELRRRMWYGNVRELRNAVEHALVVARSGVILPEHLPPPQTALSPVARTADVGAVLSAASGRRAKELLSDPAAAGAVYDRFLQEVEGPLLQSAMKQFHNECAPAARALGLHRTTLKKKLDQHGLSAPVEE